MNKTAKVFLWIFIILAVIVGLVQLAMGTFVSSQVTSAIKTELEKGGDNNPLDFNSIHLDLLGSKLSVDNFSFDLKDTDFDGEVKGEKLTFDIDLQDLATLFSEEKSLTKFSIDIKEGVLLTETLGEIARLSKGEISFEGNFSSLDLESNIQADHNNLFSSDQRLYLELQDLFLNPQVISEIEGLTAKSLFEQPQETYQAEIYLTGNETGFTIEPDSRLSGDSFSSNLSGFLTFSHLDTDPEPDTLILVFFNTEGFTTSFAEKEDFTLMISQLSTTQPVVEFVQ